MQLVRNSAWLASADAYRRQYSVGDLEGTLQLAPDRSHGRPQLRHCETSIVQHQVPTSSTNSAARREHRSRPGLRHGQRMSNLRVPT